MDPALSEGLAIAGGVITLGLSAFGSALGTGAAGSASVGAWKKCYAQGKAAPFNLLTFVGAPLTQTLYGMVLMFIMFAKKAAPAAGIPFLVIGIFAGLGIGTSAILQGRCAAAAADAQGETGKGFTNYLAAIGIVETVAIFTMVLALLGVLKFEVPQAPAADVPAVTQSI